MNEHMLLIFFLCNEIFLPEENPHPTPPHLHT
jgi:hypothetical protein